VTLKESRRDLFTEIAFVCGKKLNMPQIDPRSLVAQANRMLPPGFVLTVRDWARLDPLENDPPAYLAELNRIIANHTASGGNATKPEPWHVWLCRMLTETTGKPWRATTPFALLDDDPPPKS
jgi:hypothetical protein